MENQSTPKHKARLLYRELAQAIEARKACLKEPVNQFGLDIHNKTIKTCLDLLPSGSGWDNGTDVDLDASHDIIVVIVGPRDFEFVRETGELVGTGIQYGFTSGS